MSLSLVAAILSITDFLWPLVVVSLILGLAVTGDCDYLSRWPRWSFKAMLVISFIAILMRVLIWLAAH